MIMILAILSWLGLALMLVHRLDIRVPVVRPRRRYEAKLAKPRTPAHKIADELDENGGFAYTLLEVTLAGEFAAIKSGVHPQFREYSDGKTYVYGVDHYGWSDHFKLEEASPDLFRVKQAGEVKGKIKAARVLGPISGPPVTGRGVLTVPDGNGGEVEVPTVDEYYEHWNRYMGP